MGRDTIVPPLLITLTGSSNLTDLLSQRMRTAPHAVVAEVRRGTGSWEPVSAAQLDAQVVAVANGLVAMGIEPGDLVGIMARTRYEWTLLDFAIWVAGDVSVPLYETSSSEQVEWILSDSAARLLVVETAAHAATVVAARDNAGGGGGQQRVEAPDPGVPVAGALFLVAVDLHDRVVHRSCV